MDKFHYFDQKTAPDTDALLGMAKMQGYVPNQCLLAGFVVMSEINLAKDPCAGCNGPRDVCKGRAKS